MHCTWKTADLQRDLLNRGSISANQATTEISSVQHVKNGRSPGDPIRMAWVRGLGVIAGLGRPYRYDSAVLTNNNPVSFTAGCNILQHFASENTLF
ncbi:MAG: hypothetical protein ACK2UF_17075 [Candidatus Promineifilaceae bacterium]